MRMTKYQQKCERLSKRLKPLTEAKMEYAEKHLPAFLVARRNKVYCSECGGEARRYCDGTAVCQGCGREYGDSGSAMRAKKGSAIQTFYYGIHTTEGGEQLSRHYVVFKHATIGEAPVFRYEEVSRDYVSEKGQVAVQSLRINSMSYYRDMWIYGEELKTKRLSSNSATGSLQDISDFLTFPYTRKAAWARQRGYPGAIPGIGSISLKKMIATEPFAEWLIKKGHTRWIEKTSFYRLKTFERELVLADRHGYAIDDVSMWMDTVGAYRDMGKDTLNAKYSRFPDLKAEHDKVMAMVERRRERERRIREAEAARRKLELAIKHAEDYRRMYGAFSALSIKGAGIVVTAITDVADLVEEGKAMHHCVATYYDEEDSLILSVRDEAGARLATVEWSLSEGRVVQCRGDHNSRPDRYDDIVSLITSNKNRIVSITA